MSFDLAMDNHGFLINAWFWNGMWAEKSATKENIEISPYAWGEICNLRFQFLSQYNNYLQRNGGSKVKLEMPSKVMREEFFSQNKREEDILSLINKIAGLPEPGFWLKYIDLRQPKIPRVGKDGYLLDPEMWSGDWAYQVSEKVGIRLIPNTWDCIDKIRFQRRRHSTEPMKTGMAETICRVDVSVLYQLFGGMERMVEILALVSGLPYPRECRNRRTGG